MNTDAYICAHTAENFSWISPFKMLLYSCYTGSDRGRFTSAAQRCCYYIACRPTRPEWFKG